MRARGFRENASQDVVTDMYSQTCTHGHVLTDMYSCLLPVRSGMLLPFVRIILFLTTRLSTILAASKRPAPWQAYYSSTIIESMNTGSVSARILRHPRIHWNMSATNSNMSFTND